MGRLSDVLRKQGFTPTGEESPVSDDGRLWSKHGERVCDETGTVIDGNHHTDDKDDDPTYRYRSSNRVKMPGGYVGSYSWGHDGERFNY
jgi:hypothetical protein